MNSNKMIKFIDWYMKTDPPMRIDADFECMNMSVDDPQQKTLYINKPIGVGYNIFGNPNLKKTQN